MVGCVTGEVAFSQNSGLVTSNSWYKEGRRHKIYTLKSPTSTLAWCTPISNAIYDSTGNTPNSRFSLSSEPAWEKMVGYGKVQTDDNKSGPASNFAVNLHEPDLNVEMCMRACYE